MKRFFAGLTVVLVAGCGPMPGGFTVTGTTGPAADPRQPWDLAVLRSTGAIADDGLYNGSLPAITPDGRFVTYRSSAGSLVSPATRQYNIFLRDLKNGTTELISAGFDGLEGNSSSEVSAISADGCRVVFDSSSSNLVIGDSNGVGDVFLRDRCVTPMTTRRLSARLDGSESAAASAYPDISADGRVVVFENELQGLTRLDLQAGTLEALTGTAATGRRPSISADGARVAFWSYAPLTAGDTNGAWDIYLWTAGQVALVSTSSSGGLRDQGNESASRIVAPAISGDGRFVSFATTAANLVPNDTNGFQDVFVKDTQTGQLQLVSVSSAGAPGNNDSPAEQGGRAPLSRDGRWVVFESNATNLFGGAAQASTLTVRHDRVTGATVAVDLAASSGSGSRPALSGDADGRFVALFSAARLDPRYPSSGVFRYDTHTQPQPVAVAKLAGNLGATVQLDGTASQGNGLPLTYVWTQTGGFAVTFDDPRAAQPTFVAPQAGTYDFKLVVSDGVDQSAPSTLTVVVSDAP